MSHGAPILRRRACLTSRQMLQTESMTKAISARRAQTCAVVNALPYHSMKKNRRFSRFFMISRSAFFNAALLAMCSGLFTGPLDCRARPGSMLDVRADDALRLWRWELRAGPRLEPAAPAVDLRCLGALLPCQSLTEPSATVDRGLEVAPKLGGALRGEEGAAGALLGCLDGAPGALRGAAGGRFLVGLGEAPPAPSVPGSVSAGLSAADKLLPLRERGAASGRGSGWLPVLSALPLSLSSRRLPLLPEEPDMLRTLEVGPKDRPTMDGRESRRRELLPLGSLLIARQQPTC